MKLKDIFHETYTALMANKVRTGLTMLGIVIGIGSVIALVSIGQGAQAGIESRIQSIGANLIQISPGAQATTGGYQVNVGRGTAKTLTSDDADAIRSQVSGANLVAPEVSVRHQVTAKGTNTNTSVIGTTPDYPAVRNLTMASGSFITSRQIDSKAKVAILGPDVVTDLFGEGADPIGQSIRINGIPFSVVGVTEAKGSSGFGSQDSNIFVPLSTAQQYLSGGDYVTSISVQAESADKMTAIQYDIESLLLARHKITNPNEADFSILNQNDIVETASSVTQTFTLFLGAVAGISLLVGGIGIMNMMLTTVTERTREIGLRKAIGAKRADISFQFLVESIALTLTGGLLGIIFGALASFIVTKIGLITTEVSLSSVLLAVGVSAAIGIIFGYYPARRAAKLNPIEALRYE